MSMESDQGRRMAQQYNRLNMDASGRGNKSKSSFKKILDIGSGEKI